MIARPRPHQFALLLALLGVIALAATLRADDVQAVSLKSCALSNGQARPASGKPTYNLTVKRSGVTCATAMKVVNAFHKCRSAAASACKKTLLKHWRCTAKKESSMPLLFYGTLNCSYGSRRVRSSYQQNT